MLHERFELDRWIGEFPVDDFRESDVATALVGPMPVACVEQIRSQVKGAGGDLGKAVPVDLCVWKLGDSVRRDVTKIGGVPYWPAGEPWPTFDGGKYLTFVAQFCFADSRDILPQLPGDILSILSADPACQEQDMYARWFQLDEDLMPADELPDAKWRIEPCHAVLHRTHEHPEASSELFEEYPWPLSLWASTFDCCSKIGGLWFQRGELPDPEEMEDEYSRRLIEESWRRVNKQEQTFICQLGSIESAGRQPFVNLSRSAPDIEASRSGFLMIADVGGYDFFYDGTKTDFSWWCG